MNAPPPSTDFQTTPWCLRTLPPPGRLLYVCRVPAPVGVLLGTVEQIREVVRAFTYGAFLLQGVTGTTAQLLWTFFLLYPLTWTLLFRRQFAIHHRMPGPGPRAGDVRWAARADAPACRQWPDADSLSRDAAHSRLWAGVHIRAAFEAGPRPGRSIAGEILAHQLLPR